MLKFGQVLHIDVFQDFQTTGIHNILYGRGFAKHHFGRSW